MLPAIILDGVGEWGKMTDEQRYAKLIEYDKAHCKPPLRDTDPDELDKIWEDTKNYGKDKREKERKERGNMDGAIVMQDPLIMVDTKEAIRNKQYTNNCRKALG